MFRGGGHAVICFSQKANDGVDGGVTLVFPGTPSMQEKLGTKHTNQKDYYFQDWEG